MVVEERCEVGLAALLLFVGFLCPLFTVSSADVMSDPRTFTALAAAADRKRTTRARVIELADFPRKLQGAREMGSLGFPELIIILIIIIMIFGANRLPEIGRGIGKGIRNFKESAREGAKRDD